LAIVFSEGNDRSFCDSCDARLQERADGSSICLNCGRIYQEDETQKHHLDVQPEVSPYSSNNKDPPLISITHYTDIMKKKEEITAYEDRALERKKSGFMITESEEYLPS
jgi:DNA-directed RNA polymerase subunit M/transcription elongation factor TFIIS